jgi:hypothetical protein
MTARLTEPLWGRIAYDGAPTPLKTILFLVICATWLLPGLVGHDPWKVDEATTFGAVIDMLRTGDWVDFRIAGEPTLGHAPLYLWAAATLVKAFGGLLPLHDAARLASGVFMAVTLAFLSLSCRELMGERAGRGGVLLFIGCVGLLARAHEMVGAGRPLRRGGGALRLHAMRSSGRGGRSRRRGRHRHRVPRQRLHAARDAGDARRPPAARREPLAQASLRRDPRARGGVCRAVRRRLAAAPRPFLERPDARLAA